VVLLWLFDAALVLLEWFVAPFGVLPALNLPAPVSFVVPVPIVGALGVSILNSWFGVAVAVALALVLGKVLQWVYSLIPFKAT
jgi:hypothetical protein